MNKELLKKEWQEFVEKQIWEGEDEYTKNMGVGNVADWWIEKIQQARAEEMARVVDNIRFIYDNYWLDQKIQTSGNYKIVINREMFIKLLFSL